MAVRLWIDHDDSFEDSCEVVVVGSGAGGAFAALTLAEAGFDVVILEAGAGRSPADFSPYLGHAMSRMYNEAGFHTMAGRPPIAVASGRALGGSTVVNSAICFRTPERVLAHWNELSGGAFEDADAYYRTMDAVEAMLRVGPTPDRLLSGLDKVHKEAATALGWSNHNFRRNTPTCAGCGRCNQGCPVGGKMSVDLAVLPRVQAAGARIHVRCQVQTVDDQGLVQGYITTVEGRDDGAGPAFSVRASRAVILAGGALNTPRILFRSGLASKADEIGRGLMIHPVFSILGFWEDRPIVSGGSTQGHYVDEFDADEMLLESNPTVAGQPFQMLPMHGLEAKRYIAKSNHFASSGAMIKAATKGRILPNKGPAIRARFALSHEDKLLAIQASTRAAELWLNGLGADFVLLPLYGQNLVRNMAEVKAAMPDDIEIGRFLGFTSHPLATCSVGRATDLDGRVPGTENVFCLDGSALPTNVGRNPQISVMTVARTLAERLTERLGKTPKPLWDKGPAPPSVPQPGTPAGLYREPLGVLKD
jgi:choline dehydrogenase-like flavoprotein